MRHVTLEPPFSFFYGAILKEEFELVFVALSLFFFTSFEIYRWLTTENGGESGKFYSIYRRFIIEILDFDVIFDSVGFFSILFETDGENWERIVWKLLWNCSRVHWKTLKRLKIALILLWNSLENAQKLFWSWFGIALKRTWKLGKICL